MRRRALALLPGLALLLGACQLADEPALEPAGHGTGSVEGEDAVGTPLRGQPTTVDGLRERAQVPAREWQPDPRLSELWVALDEEGRPERARLTYLAADADRFLVVRLDGGGMSLQQPTLETLELNPVTAGGMEELPALADDVLDPVDLVAAAEPALAECDVAPPVRTLVYTTGAPMAWDGERWAEPPEWSATLLADGGGAVVDPADGTTPLTCFTADG